jgi:DUF4097 and DUF4098 domain-containing protein YvlB
MPTYDTSDPIAVTIELAIGDVHVIASDRDDTVVAVNPSDRSRAADAEAAGRTTVAFDVGRLAVQAPRPRGLGKVVGPGSRSGSVDIVVEVPSGSHLRSDAALGNVRADGRLGDVRVKVGVGNLHLDATGDLALATGTGSITVGRVAGDATIRGAGEVRVTAVRGDADVKNLNGGTWVGEVTGELTVRSSNGDITIHRSGGQAIVKTANGGICVDEVASGSLDLATGNGRLDVGIAADTAAWVDAHSRFGRITRELDDVPMPGDDRRTAEVRARTSHGDIAIHRT